MQDFSSNSSSQWSPKHASNMNNRGSHGQHDPPLHQEEQEMSLCVIPQTQELPAHASVDDYEENIDSYPNNQLYESNITLRNKTPELIDATEWRDRRRKIGILSDDVTSDMQHHYCFDGSAMNNDPSLQQSQRAESVNDAEHHLMMEQ
eukprot:4830562-Ditylum_brightwellii.AAC.1